MTIHFGFANLCMTVAYDHGNHMVTQITSLVTQNLCKGGSDHLHPVYIY